VRAAADGEAGGDAGRDVDAELGAGGAIDGAIDGEGDDPSAMQAVTVKPAQTSTAMAAR
jgi:hypothetical protein